MTSATTKYDYTTLTFPTAPSFDGEGYEKAFPAFNLDYDSQDDDQEALLAKQLHEQIDEPLEIVGALTSLEIVGDWWVDDHLYCADLVVTVAGKKYGISLVFLGIDEMKVIFQAETGGEKYLEAMREMLVRRVHED